MKIKKLNESKKLIEADVDPMKDSAAEIVDEIKDTVTAATDGTKEITDQDAKAIADQTKEAGDEVNAGYVAFNLTDDDWSDVTITNEVYETLDDAYNNALINMEDGIKAGSNVLINGLPGSGKTAIVEAWCKMKGLELVAMNATDSKSDAAVNGMPLRDQDKPDELIYLFNNKKLGKLLDPAYAKKCVVFVDELNRQKTAQLRRPLMSLFNEKRNADGSKDFSKNLLFSIVCINPADSNGNRYHDDGLVNIFGAEDDIFEFQIDQFDSTIQDALSFYTWYRQSELQNLGIILPGTKASDNHDGWVGPTRDLTDAERNKAKRILKVCELAIYILKNVTKSSESEVFSQRGDIDAEYREGPKRAVSARGLFDACVIAVNNVPLNESPVKKFLKYIDVRSKYSSKKVQMFHDILDTYIMDVKGLFNNYNIDKTPQEIKHQLENGADDEYDADADQATNNTEVEDDTDNFSDSDMGEVSQADTSDISDIDALMKGWGQK